jgi:protein TonB
VREWLRAGLIVSVAIHVIVFLAFQLRFHDDLERASGASAALSSQGTIMIPVEVVVEARLPSAPAPTNATPDAREAKPTEDVSIDKLMPKPVQPAPVVIQQSDVAKLFPKTEPAPVAKEPEAPTTMVVPEQTPAPKREQAKPIEREKKTARATPSAAASPSHAASANSSGSAGAGGQVTTGGSAAISSYQAQVLSHLQQHRVYPPEARARGITGVARVQFALARDGRVLSVSLIGNGERVLDNAAIDMVRRASPFPPFPPGLSQPRIDFVAPVRFDLQ